jgi:UDP-N-acetyl-D-glucosamine/UDP-N-acetyl-D-galactosamine dehydrogenase
MSFKASDQPIIAIIGMGYVGLPLAVEFGKKFTTIGFDINLKRIEELKQGIDRTLEVEPENLKSSTGISFTADSANLSSANVFIITVPTPVDKFNNPDLSPLLKASETVSRYLKPNDVVIYESTVYPGVTEEECVPLIEKRTGMKFNVDFFAGYSPERINPGDKKHTVTKIRKVTSGSTPEVAKFVDNLYGTIIEAGTFSASCIRVAEAAKVIENAQRDINIAFVNELSKIFNLLGIDTQQVLEAAGTKWNFLNFRPGLVGGHCIGVDPYYLAQKAQEHGYHPEIILAGRRLNDGMGKYIGTEVVRLLIQRDQRVKGARLLVLGITFKENCPDVRNTKVVDVIETLSGYGMEITIYDPWASKQEVLHEYGLSITSELSYDQPYDAILLAVAHAEFAEIDYNKLKKTDCLIYDIKSFLPAGLADYRL